MSSGTEDDFRVFDGQKHMFFGISNPYEMIRYEFEDTLRNTPPHFQVEQITAYGTPKFVTLFRQVDPNGEAILSHFGFSFRAKVRVSSQRMISDAIIDVVMTFFFGDVDLPKPRKIAFFDLKNTEDKFTDELFAEKFVQFRHEIESEYSEVEPQKSAVREPWWKFW